MTDTPYTKFECSDLILRDELAIDRTILANERTLLAYLRSGVSLLIAGVTLMHFVPDGWLAWIGLACIPTGLAASIVGIVRYRRMNTAIGIIRRRNRDS